MSSRTQHPSYGLPARRIHLDGPVNFRDLGGYTTSDGGSVRWRQVFRSDALHEMTDRDAEAVFGDLGVSLVIDLRSAREVDLVGIGPVGASGATWVHLSLVDETQPIQEAWKAFVEDVPMSARYARLLAMCAPRLVDGLRLIAESDAPLVFHCTAGKDRTGLLAALLLSVLGVGEDDIALDYAATSAVLHTIADRYFARADDPRFAAQVEAVPGWREQASRLMTADASTMRCALGELRENGLTVVGWLAKNGLQAGTMSQLRERLVEH